MITCNRCGKLVQAGLAYCQNCGMPLSSANQASTDPSKGAHEQSELPAWLESLRANERPGPPANEPPYFSTGDLIDEGALPSWMHPENAEMLEKGISGKYPAWRPASMPAPNTEASIPPRGFSVGSLIDEQSLPSWVQGNQANPQATPGATFGAHDPQRSFSAADLNQPDNQPGWMQTLAQLSQSAAPSNSVWGGGERSFDSQVRMNSSSPNPAGVDPNHPSQRYSAHDLVDPQALPGWMSGQPGQPGWQAGYPPNAARQGGQAGFSASSLLDMNSLPSWLRENEPAQGQGYPNQVGANSPAQPGQIPNGNGSLSGASLIDANALPGWLQSYEAQQQTGMPPNARPASYGATPRIDSVRVPSRPRTEMVPHAQSEVAANVFSSMLGVASSAPYFPSAGAQANLPDGNALASQQGFQPEQPRAAGAQWNAPSQPPAYLGVPVAQGYNPNPAAYPGGYQGTQPAGEFARPGSYPMSGQPGMTQQPSGFVPGKQPEPPVTNQRSNTNSSGSKPAKRGFFETILSWFPR